jgi:hypothetical protein
VASLGGSFGGLKLALKSLSFSIAFIGSDDSDITGCGTSQHLEYVPMAKGLEKRMFSIGS